MMTEEEYQFNLNGLAKGQETLHIRLKSAKERIERLEIKCENRFRRAVGWKQKAEAAEAKLAQIKKHQQYCEDCCHLFDMLEEKK